MTEELTVKTCLKTIAIKLNALQLFMGTVKKQLSAQTLASFIEYQHIRSSATAERGWVEWLRGSKITYN